MRLLLACTLFSALQGLAGAWVVSSLAHGPVVEVCTPLGMQWVTVESLETDAEAPGPDDLLWPQGLAKPCAWAMAHLVVPSGVDRVREAVPQPRPAVASAPRIAWVAPVPDTVDRVLLNAPMRAPPAVQA